MFVPVAPPTASPTALDLGTRLVRTIEEYKELHPELGSRDIYMALRIAGQSTGARRIRPAMALVFGLLLAGWLAIVLLRQKGGASAAESMPFVVAAVAGLLAVLLVLVVIRRQ